MKPENKGKLKNTNDKISTVKDDKFFENVAGVIEQARRHVGRTADLTMCVTYFEIGRMIVEREQGGKIRAEYRRGLLKELAVFLKERFGNGFSLANLKSFRKFYLVYSSSILRSSSTVSEKGQTMSAQFNLFKLSWSHYQVLMRITDEKQRSFYEIESIDQQWTVRQLQDNTAAVCTSVSRYRATRTR